MERVVFRPLRDAVAGGDARRDVRGRVPAAEHRAARVRPLGKIASSLASLNQPVSDLRRRHPEDHDRRDRRGRRLSARARARCSNARAIGLHMRAAAMDFRTARLLGVRANRVIGSAVLLSGAARGGRRGHPHRPDAARHARLRAARDDHRPRRRRRRRHRPPGLGDPRRLRDRLRVGASWAARCRPTRASTCRPSCSRSSSSCCSSVRRGLFARGARRGGARMRRVHAHAAARAALVLVVARPRCSARSSRARPRSTSSTRSSSVAIVVALYVFVGNSGVALVRPHQLRRRRRLRRGRARPCRPTSKPAVLPDALRASSATTTIGNFQSLLLAAAVGGALRVPRRAAADAAVGARGGHRDVRRARDHAQHPPLLDEDRARCRMRSRSCPRRPASCRRRSGALVVDRRRVRLPAEPVRPAAARDARGSAPRRRRSASRLPPAARGRSRSPARSPGFAGGLYVHLLGRSTTEQVYLELTFLTLAMLVVGGVTSLWGAVVGALASAGSTRSSRRRRTASARLHARPADGHARSSSVGALMALVLILRPSGITGGRELSLRAAAPPPPAKEAA